MISDLNQEPVFPARRESPLRIVAIGGGNGLSSLLHGLKAYARSSGEAGGDCGAAGTRVDITAIVTVTDDGGSSGRLRRDFKVLPPGDIRNCMVALSEDEALLSRLFQYRFANGRGLKGHSFGNLFLTALTDITGDFAQAVKVSSEVLAIAGRIYPSTSSNVVLKAELENGAVVSGETRISRSQSRIRRISLEPESCLPMEETLAAIGEADLITLGPGSLYTSVVPNLLVDGISQAIADSPAVKANFVNLMWQPGETMHFTAADHVLAILEHARLPILDYAVVNNRSISEGMRRKYESEQVQPVQVDLDRLTGLGITLVGRDLLQEGEKVRHSPEAIAAVALELAWEGRRRRRQKNVMTA
ncbi:MAG TPA: gluconeogenesis factor YvcK family protein [Bryobacteraceae bacterium]|nr:gluconeogenesis factor YvcK family protein [Bryobacteraceae bacterium]